MPFVLLSLAEESDLILLERSLLIRHLGFIVRVRSTCGYLLYLYFKDREELGVLEVVRGQQLR